MGLYHDDWSLFRVKDLVPAAEYGAFFVKEFRDRPVLAPVIRAMNDVWNGEAWQITLMASGFVALAALALYQLLAKVAALAGGDRLAAALGTAAWIALPWGLGYSLWTIGTTTLVAVAAFLGAATLIVGYVHGGGAWRLPLVAVLLGVSFLTYQSCYLGFLPAVLLGLALAPRGRPAWLRAGAALAVGLAVQVSAVLQSLGTTPKSTGLDPILLLKNVTTYLPRAMGAPFGKLWPVLAVAVLALVVEAVRSGRQVEAGARRTARAALLACLAGVVVGTLPYSVAGYRISGLGIFSRTTVAAGLWACILLAVAAAAACRWPEAGRRRFLRWSAALVAVLAVASAVRMTAWARSWRRQQDILAAMPLDAIARLPPDAVVLLDEPRTIDGVEVFAAPWDISSAVYSQPRLRGRPPAERITVSPIYRDVTMSWDRRELTVRPGWKIPARELYLYRPGGALVRVESAGPIVPAAL
jgi:hypothetical protein